MVVVNTGYPPGANIAGAEAGTGPNALLPRLAANLMDKTGPYPVHQVILEPMEIVAFHLKTFGGPGASNSAEPFVYPRSFYLDRFLLDNVPLADRLREQEREMLAEVEVMKGRRGILTQFEVHLQHLPVFTLARSLIHRTPEPRHPPRPPHLIALLRTPSRRKGRPRARHSHSPHRAEAESHRRPARGER